MAGLLPPEGSRRSERHPGRGQARHPLLGYCHSGFLEGMDTVADELSLAVDKTRPYALTGHSLGAARALVVAALPE